MPFLTSSPIGTPERAIEDPTAMYVEWREACVALRMAYERWSSVRVAERNVAFAVYQAALDLEEHASAVYADRVGRAAHRRRPLVR